MILGFKEFFDTKKKRPTYFREKILSGVHPNLGAVGSKKYPITYPRTLLLNPKPKLHTFRLDPHDRWKPGMSIQMVYRGPKYSIKDHFNKGIPELEKCISVQAVKIAWEYDDSPYVFVDGRELGVKEISTLAINDGFNSYEDFFAYFNKDFVGKIIHWTDLRY